MGYVKIGITKNSIQYRYPGISTNDILLDIPCNLYDAFIMEQNILHDFVEYKAIVGEAFAGHTECLCIAPNTFLKLLLG